MNIYDIESEEQVLCSFLLNPELLYQVDLRPYHFSDSEYRAIYTAMLKLYADGISIDFKTLKDADSSIKTSTFFHLMNVAVTSANVHYHAQRIKDAAFNRACLKKLKELESSIGDRFLVEAEKKIMELYEFRKNSKNRPVPELLSEIRYQIKRSEEEGRYGVATGFKKLDEAIVGLCPRQFVILGGYLSYGKSTFLSQLLANVCGSGYSVLIFSLEDSKEDKLIRLLSTLTDVPIRNIVRNQIEPLLYSWAEEKISGYKLSIYDDVYTLEEMDLKIKKHRLQQKVDVVAIDYVQNLKCEGDIYERMSTAAITLQQFAKKHNVNMFVLSQVSREEKGQIKLRGAQELAGAADIVLWIDRDAEKGKREFDLVIRKNRPFGKTGRIKMSFSESWTQIKEL